MSPVAVVMNMFYTGLGIARSLGEQGIRVIGLTAHRGIYGNFTRYATLRACPDSREDFSVSSRRGQEFRGWKLRSRDPEGPAAEAEGAVAGNKSEIRRGLNIRISFGSRVSAFGFRPRFCCFFLE